jgi:hypothetical protein
MIPKIIPTKAGGARAGGGAVFGRVANYITDKAEHERGQVLTADCVLSAETAVAEMEAVAFEAPRCKEPAMHVVLAWHPGEHPTEQQQREAVGHVLASLQDKDGHNMSAHQWVAVLHTDKHHDHLHILINRVNPDTGRAVSPAWSQRSLHKAAREIEAAQGWKETPGLSKWSKELNQAVPTPAAELVAGRTPEKAARMEAHQTAESLTGYVQRSGVARELGEVLKDSGATWADVQRTLGRHGLELHKGEKGGFTVSDGGVHAKASNALRSVFSGKAARERLERLGEWVGADKGERRNAYTPNREPEPRAQLARRDDPQAEQRRAERAEERAQARAALRERYEKERAEWTRNRPPPSREAIKERFKRINDELKAERQGIRKRTAPKSNARIAAESVAAFRKMEKEDKLRADLAAERQANRPPSWQAWVTDKANAGDKAAQAQIRGWEYAKKRTPEAVRAPLERNEHRQPSSNEGATAGVEWRRRWFIGGVEYKIDGKAAVIDKGAHLKLVGGSRADDRSIALMLGLQAAKTGGNVGVTGSREFKERCAWLAAEKGLSVKFADPKLQAHYEAQKAQIKQFNQQRAEERKQPQKQQGEARRPTTQAIITQRQREEKAHVIGRGLGRG